VYIDGTGAVSNTLLGNMIGVDATGIIYMGNEYQGIALCEGADYTSIGSTAPGHGNTIAGNGGSGVKLGSDHNLVAGNVIGRDGSGPTNPPNGTGVRISSAAAQNVIKDNVISGNLNSGILARGWGNRIEHNEVYGNMEYGVHVKGTGALSNAITHNSIHLNRRLGIKLEDGGNAGLPAPDITSYSFDSGSAAGTSCALCTVEVFSDGEDEGETFEGIAVADGTGTWSLDTGAPFDGPKLTATAIDPDGNTSEFGVAKRPYQVHLPVALRNAGSP
jgi:parallel beta-helix repeat protein